jgi:hypothetical protein
MMYERLSRVKAFDESCCWQKFQNFDDKNFNFPANLWQSLFTANTKSVSAIKKLARCFLQGTKHTLHVLPSRNAAKNK